MTQLPGHQMLSYELCIHPVLKVKHCLYYLLLLSGPRPHSSPDFALSGLDLICFLNRWALPIANIFRPFRACSMTVFAHAKTMYIYLRNRHSTIQIPNSKKNQFQKQTSSPFPAPPYPSCTSRGISSVCCCNENYRHYHSHPASPVVLIFQYPLVSRH